jgi:hypothetical protein
MVRPSCLQRRRRSRFSEIFLVCRSSRFSAVEDHCIKVRRTQLWCLDIQNRLDKLSAVYIHLRFASGQRHASFGDHLPQLLSSPNFRMLRYAACDAGIQNGTKSQIMFHLIHKLSENICTFPTPPGSAEGIPYIVATIGTT